MQIAVFCASSNRIDHKFFEAARNLGALIGRSGNKLVYGGTNVGLMNEVAVATFENGGEVIGIIPRCIQEKGISAGCFCHLMVAADMKERKHLLRENADAFVALPGGWGTLEEITEVITLKQLGIHRKPIVFLNTSCFYDTFFRFIESIRMEGFVSGSYDNLYTVVNTAEEVWDYLQNYRISEMELKYQ